ncbi:MAG: hypothetical protein EXR80_06930 [Methylococcales bacterium]|nr:hypothetical protein [Methylococcales bacterium]
MNIFYLNASPTLCAQQHVNKHVVKMIVEYAQLLSTTHRLLDGMETVGVSAAGRSVKRWQLPDERDELLYHATHGQHPSALWTRHSGENYQWLYQLFIAVLAEYTFRYEKVHATARLIKPLQLPPNHIVYQGFSEPTPAMPDDYKVAGDVVQSYRNYYRGSKSHFFAWQNRPVPDWIA